jgi:Beta/Gamma crystallin
MRLLKGMLAAAALFGAAAASAQEITLFQNQNFSGPQFSASNSIQNLDHTGFNDRASSVIIRGGSWQLCADAFFRGQCVTLNPGQYPSLAAMGLNNSVSSIRETGWSGGGGGGGGGGGPGWGGGGGGGGAITLYDSPGLSGRSYTANGPINNLDDVRFNDRASSALISNGTWQICADADFQSSCEVLGPGRHDNLGGVTGRVSSIRPIAGSGGGGGGGGWSGGGGGGGWGGSARVVMYENPGFSGRSFVINSDVVNNFGTVGFNDRASSLRVERGYWMFCTDANFMGECRTLGPGDYPNLPYGLSNRISSGRRISNDYPYGGAPPNWRN